MHFGYDNIQASSNRRLVAELSVSQGDFEFQLPGFAGGAFGLDGGEHFWSIPSGGGRLDAALQIDLSNLESGQYDYELTSGLLRLNNDVFSGSTSASTGEILHVNSINGAFGSGWGLTGLQKIVENEDGSLLLIDGDGSELLFELSDIESGTYESPLGDFSTLEKLQDGTFRRTLTDQTVFNFNVRNQLALIRDRNNNEIQYVYNDAGQLIEWVDPVGLTTTFSYTNDRITSITDPAGRETQLEYDEAGDLIRITDPDDTSRQFEYDNRHHIIAEVDKRGNREETFYDFAGRAERSIQKDGSVIEVDPVQVNGLYRPEQTIDPLNAPLAFQIGDVAESSYVDANGNTITYTLDQMGQIVSARDEIGALPTTRRNEDNLITQQIDARGNITSFTYDEQGNVLSIRDSLSFALANNVGDQALIINGSSGTSESGTTANSTNSLEILLQELGLQTTISDEVPEDLSIFSQVWDIRFSNNLAISTTQEEQYLNFLEAGGDLFVIGENSFFQSRNNSLLNLIEEAGGGRLSFVTPSEIQLVSYTF